MPDIAQLGILITADDRASRTLRDVERQTQQTTQSINGMSASSLAASTVMTGGLLAIGAAAAAMAAQGVRSALEFEHALTGVKAVLSPAELAASGGALRALALQLGTSGLGFSATEAAQGLEAMSKAGISVKDQMAGASSVLALAAAGSLKVGEAADFAANTLSVFKLQGTDMAHVADLMAGAANATTADVGDLRLSMQQFGAVANLTGQNVDSATTAIALLAQAGIRGSDAGTSLKTMFLNLQPTTEKQRAEMERLGLITNGVNAFINQQTGEFKQAGEIAAILNQRLGGLTAAQKAASLEIVFGSDAIRAATVLTNAGAEGWANLTNEINKTSAMDVARARTDDLTGSIKNLQAAGQVLAVGLSEDLGPAMRRIVDGATDATKALIKFREEAAKHPAPETKIGGVSFSAGSNLTQLFNPQTLNQQVQQQVTQMVSPSLGQSLENGLREQRIGERLAATLSHETYLAGIAGADAIAEGFGNRVVNVSERIASEVGAALQANKGNIEGAITDLMGKESGPALDQAVAQTLQRADALKAVGAVLNTLAPAERAHYEAMLLANGAADKANQSLTVLSEMLTRGTITQEQYNAALSGGALAQRTLSEAQAKATEAALGGAIAVRAHQEALQRQQEAALGGAVAIRAHNEDLEREKTAALGGALAIRSHNEDLAREKEAALGGAVAIRDHAEALARQKEAALGGALAIRDHEEALAREKEANLGGALAIRDHAEALQREHEAALGGVAAIRDHEDALAREKTAALGGEVGIRAHAEALNEEKIAALGGRAAILDHQAALQKLDNQAKMAQTTFATLADKMAVWAKMGTGGTLANPFPETLVNQALNYKTALSAIDQVTAQLANNSQKAEIDALKNANDLWGALTQSVEMAGLGYQDIAGLINGEREATERLNESIQRNTQYRAAQRTAIQQANEAQFRSAITATGQGGGLPQYAPAGLATGGNNSPFGSSEFAQWYAANYGERERFINQMASPLTQAGQAQAATVEPIDRILERFTNRFMESFEQVQAHERDKIVEALSHAGETRAQQETRLTGVPTVQTNIDNTAQGLAQQALRAIEATMTVQQAAQLEYVAQLQGASAALATQGRSINTTLTAEEALAEATDGLTGATRIQHITRADLAAAAAEEARAVRHLTVGTGDAARAISSMPGNIESWAMSIDDLTKAQQDYWQALKGNAEALRNNTTVIAGLTIGAGQTYGQIYGQSGTTSGASGGSTGGSHQGIVNVNPGNYYGIPVVSPITGGTLRGFADGPMVPEPSYLTSVRTGRTYGMAAEHGPEPIGYGLRASGSTAITIQINASGVDALRDAAFWEQAVSRQIRPALRRVGVQV